MTTELASLISQRDTLVRNLATGNGVKSVTVAGTTTVFESAKEVQQRIDLLDRQIQQLRNRQRIVSIDLSSSFGSQ